ncbi:MAG TPA: zinc ribbon domain-containing protein [Candidatus Angelobacter sp.]|nr:zinc ribbon domain-containing protein [Candidatus Angelobacter sp.]
MGEAPVVPYTGFDAAMARDQARLAEMKQQFEAGVPLGRIRASSPLEMPGNYAEVANITDRPKPAADFNEETLRNLTKLYDELDTQPPTAATVVNFHPIALRVNGGRHYTQHVAPCPPQMCLNQPGRQCTYLTIHDAVIDPVPQESGNHVFDKIPPIWKAQQYMNVANGNLELWGPGSFIYEGELTPEEMWERNPIIRTFTDQGLPIFAGEQEVDGQRSGRVRKVRTSQMRPYREVYLEFLERRNKAYFEIVTRVDSEYHQTDLRGRKNVGINGMTRDQAQVCVNLGLLLKPPEWLTVTRVEAGVAQEKCSNCGADVLAKAVMCQSCGWPVDPEAAYLGNKISIEHEALNDLPSQKLAELYRVDAQRKQNRARAQELAKALGNDPAKDPAKNLAQNQSTGAPVVPSEVSVTSAAPATHEPPTPLADRAKEAAKEPAPGASKEPNYANYAKEAKEAKDTRDTKDARDFKTAKRGKSEEGE